MKGRKLTTLSHKEKREICHHKQENPTLTNKELQAWALETFQQKVHEATISRILKKSFALLSNVTSDDMKRKRNALNPEVEEALFKWFLTAQEARLTISDDILIEKARGLHTYLQGKNSEVKDCKFTVGWLMGFKRRHNIQLRTLHGKELRTLHGKGDVFELTEETWNQFNDLKVTLSSYDPCDIFNMDEMSLFFKLHPNCTLRDSAVKGQKNSKDRITIGLCTNMDGSIKLPPLVIHKTRNPSAFSNRKIKRPNNLGIFWYSNNQAWMTSEIFQDWLLKIEDWMKANGRKQVALLVDNAPGHLWAPIVDKLSITRVLCLPANTTARFQPMDAGIVSSFKCQYRRIFLMKMLADLESNRAFEVDIYEAVMWTVSAWTDGVREATIRNCWKHCDFETYRDVKAERSARDIDLEAPLQDADLTAQMEELGGQLERLSLKYPVTLTVKDYIDADSVGNAPTFPVDVDLSDFLQNHIPESKDAVVREDSDNAGEDGEGPVQEESEARFPSMTYNIGIGLLENLRLFLEQQEYDTYAMTQEVNKMIRQVTKEHQASLVQTNLQQFFELEIAHSDCE